MQQGAMPMPMHPTQYIAMLQEQQHAMLQEQQAYMQHQNHMMMRAQEEMFFQMAEQQRLHHYFNNPNKDVDPFMPKQK